MTSSINLSNKHGVTAQKKAELQVLAEQVLMAQHEVDRLQAMVNALTEKSVMMQADFSVAESSLDNAVSNNNMLTQLLQNINALNNDAPMLLKETAEANAKNNVLASAMKQVTGKLIFSAKMINKLAALVIREKALNPLIPDELVMEVTIAETTIKNAIELTLVALRSIFNAQVANTNSKAGSEIIYEQCMQLELLLKRGDDSLAELLGNAHDAANLHHNLTMNARLLTSATLKQAITDLNIAQVKLKSLQNALAAGNAAAMAS